jgi:ferredoxin
VTAPAAGDTGHSTKAPLRVRADRERCCASGLCAMTVPDVFDQREEDGLVTVLQPEPPAALREAVREAAECCPAGAITVTGD